MVDADSETEKALELLAVGRREAGVSDRFPDRGLFLLAGELHAGQLLCSLCAFPLGEVDQIDRGLVGLHQLLDRLVQRCLAVAVVERHRPLVRLHQRSGAAVSRRRRIFLFSLRSLGSVTCHILA